MWTTHRLLATIPFVTLVGTCAPTWAQTPVDVSALKAEVARLKASLARVESQIAALEQAAAGTAVAAEAPAQPAVPYEAPPPDRPEHGLSQVAQYIQQHERLTGDASAAARVDNVPIDPEMAGFFRFPGTDTVMRIGGYAKLDAIYDFSPAGDPDMFITSTIPTGSTLGLNSFNLHVRQTRVNLDLRRPVGSDDLRVYVESDFDGLKPNLFRMRHAYGQWKNLLVGQSFTTFMDVDALAETVDFEGPPSTVFVLQPQVR